jgi:hypothetical protein
MCCIRCASTHHQNSDREQWIAFGGYSFPGVGQYEFITGTATGEVDPSNPQNAIITGLQLALPRNANNTVSYQHNFYILKPLDLSKGNHKTMYEPPNRGNKTYQALNNADRHQRSAGANWPGCSCRFLPLDARLHDSMESLGKQSRAAERPGCDGGFAGRLRLRWLDSLWPRLRIYCDRRENVHAASV